MTGCAWIWLYIGAFLMLMEIVASGFVLFFFGLSAATVGLCRFVFGTSFSPSLQLAAFSIFSVLYLVYLRRWLKGLFDGASEISAVDFNRESIGRIGKVTEAINPPMLGRVMIGDLEWTASAESPISVGADVKVVSQSNLTMQVTPIS